MVELFAAFGINWKLLLAQAVNFGVLLLLLRYFLFKRVLKILDDRRAKIARGVHDAEAATKHLAQAHEEGRGIVGEAAREAEGLVDAARARAVEKESEIMHGAEERAQRLLKEALASAAEAKRQVLQDSEREIARTAILAAEKILRQKSA